jgi:peptidoglycan/LPS O-acetylase OafA/YrhL
MWVRIIVLIAGSIGVPALLYAAVEKPLMLVGVRVARRRMRHPVHVS